ncbi:hypothetical protein SDC9_94073 [bioreactor metagenome]|uniref:Uncharacterized protein n=1 Tax=bioreactor metagenome TaxID=1076179 RepID=A0A645ACF2_9ZZZZ
MVAVDMAYEDFPDLQKRKPISPQLHLAPLPTVN